MSIVLKVDQGSGREVRGIVEDLLTRGDHPRGVKVRLRDGRVGRVQRLVSEAEGIEGEEKAGGIGANLGGKGENAGGGGRGGRGGMGGRGGFKHEKDIRDDDEYIYDEERVGQRDMGLFAQLEEADKRHETRQSAAGSIGTGGEIATCPVCGEFEGDERAVAFHVEGHFAEG